MQMFAADALAVELLPKGRCPIGMRSPFKNVAFVVMSSCIRVISCAWLSGKWFDLIGLSVVRNTNSCTVEYWALTNTEIVCLAELQLPKKKPSYKNIQGFNQKSPCDSFFARICNVMANRNKKLGSRLKWPEDHGFCGSNVNTYKQIRGRRIWESARPLWGFKGERLRPWTGTTLQLIWRNWKL